MSKTETFLQMIETVGSDELCNIISVTGSCGDSMCFGCPFRTGDGFADVIKELRAAVEGHQPETEYPALFRSVTDPITVVAFTSYNSGVRVAGPQCGITPGTEEGDWSDHRNQDVWTPVDLGE